MHEEKITYTIAEAGEIDEIFSMYQSAIRTMCEAGIEQWDEFYPDREIVIEDICKKELFVGKIKAKICVVYVLNQEYDDDYKNGHWKYPDAKYCIIHRLCVNPEFQHCGLAVKTILHIEEQCRENGFEAIRLDSYSKNPYAVKLYDKLGYTVVGNADWRKGIFDLREKKLQQK